MTLRVVVLRSAEEDLKTLKRYLLSNFGSETWQASYGQIKDAIASLRAFPAQGRIPDELAHINLSQYREVVAGMNRIIYDVRGDTIHVHIVCDTRRDLKSLLMRRLMQAY
ncbi:MULTISPECIES: type II toxin-antitoxin system RelE/ParE family toxin [Burkholderia]|uniref:type II toxin-antitoxin system RelE/ParE family toxin n=1 Tax=unclassified Burkholderia TaxID=2613784 RepID=UPI000B7A3764|nr:MULTISPECIES: type II toxin-antitoxin system RelE/ParE family toxin [unclassified Burkholderia]MBR8235475.1 type II toxin-antitoxin system RelE/ParE family toxin [Burkholderia sp. AU32357]MBY4873626.1 type II toxin-antitoxin system RelE/ParE family toxin [Burkholderia sp. AU42008]OXI40104.1 plasmid stabilization protein [Burkholderia sp. AU17457]OXI66631.1 plasmid stabilization protein [Burkholderia sp. AU28863]